MKANVALTPVLLMSCQLVSIRCSPDTAHTVSLNKQQPRQFLLQVSGGSPNRHLESVVQAVPDIVSTGEPQIHADVLLAVCV